GAAALCTNSAAVTRFGVSTSAGGRGILAFLRLAGPLLALAIAAAFASSASARGVAPAGHPVLMSARPLVGVKPAHGRLVHRVRVQNQAAYRALKRRAIRRAERSGAFGPSSPSAPHTALFNGLSAPGLAASDDS